MKIIKSITASAACLFAAVSQLGAVQLHVSPSGSDTEGDGGIQKPYATLSKAFSVASKDTGPSEIILEEGVYFMPRKGVEMKGYPTAQSPLTIRGVGKVVLHGGVRVPADALVEVRRADMLAKLPAKREGHLYAFDLKNYGVTRVGGMRAYGFGSMGGAAHTEAFFSKMPLTLAQYPNGSEKIPLGRVLENGFNKNEASAWDPSKEKIGGVFAYTDPRHERWTQAKDMWLSGIFHHGWAYNTVRVKKIDKDAKSVTLEAQLPWGVQKSHHKLVVNAYQAINLFEEMDAIGEYYIDRENLYFYVLLDRRPDSSEYFDFSLLDVPFIKLSNVEGLTLKNINFTASRATAISGNGCARVVIDGCNFNNLGSRAVNISAADVSKYSPERLAAINNEFKNGKVYDTGAGGVTFSGGNEELLLPSHNKIYNSEFWNNARLQKSYSAQAHLLGVGGILSHCYFHDHSHMSVGYSGSEHLFEFNYFERCCRDFDDMGVIYTGRLPYNRGNVIRGNFFAETVASHKSSMMCGVYVDDGSGGTLVEKNIFCRVGTPGRGGGFSAVYFHAGKDNIVKDNVFIDCDVAASQVQWGDERWGTYWKQYPTHLKYVDSEVYLKKYPEMKNIMDPSLKRMNVLRGGRLFRTKPPLRGKWDLHLPMEEMSPDIPCGKVDYWDMAQVRKYFGRDSLVKEILGWGPGLVKQP